MRFRIAVFLCLSSCIPLWGAEGVPLNAEGEKIYRNQCASCHGAGGEGVAEEYDEPLYGDRSIESLARLIHKTMPEEAPEECVDEDAKRVAEYIYHAFYSEEARSRSGAVRRELSRLTADQLQQSAADVVGSFRRSVKIGKERGLRAEYFDDRRLNRSKRRIERTDPEVRFQFGAKSPDSEKIKDEAFAIGWRGAVLVEETGVYEFCVRTENGFKLYVNDHLDRALIDGWVSSGELTEKRAQIHLLGGRAYPIRLEYFKFKDKSASIELRWKPPGDVERVIPSSFLAPVRVPPVMVVSTPLPADDRSMGYVRGTAVSQVWQKATTSAALEIADHVVSDLRELADIRGEDAATDRRAAKAFCREWLRRAFRRPLSEAEEHLFGEAFRATGARRVCREARGGSGDVLAPLPLP